MIRGSPIRDDTLVRPAGRVGLVEEIVDSQVRLEPLAEASFHVEVASVRQHVEVVLELIADPAPGDVQVEPVRVRETERASDGVHGPLSQGLTLEARLLGRVDDMRVGEEVAQEKAKIAGDPYCLEISIKKSPTCARK